MSTGELENTRLTGRWLTLARTTWVVLVALALGLFIAGIPSRYAEMQHPFLNYLRLVLFPVLFAAFPNGRVVPRAMWIVIVLWSLRNFISVFWLDPPSLIAALTDFAWLALFLTGIAAQMYRYVRVSTFDERKQTKWVVFGFALLVTVVVAVVPFYARDATLQGVSVRRLVWGVALGNVILLIPATLAIAIFRNRLWDIDLIIRRTLVYSVLTGLLALTYFGSVVVLQNLIGSSQSPLITVLSTLAIAALFIPLRQRVQDAIDRRFYRRKYDAAKTLAEFAATARDETDLDKLTTRLVEVVDETMQPESVGLWLRKDPSGLNKPPRSEP